MTQETKHTPGSWYVISSHHDDGVTYHINTHEKDTIQGERLCQTLNPANARLIAAAPELLEALENLLNDIEVFHLASGVTFETSESRKVIAKAKGL